MKSQGGVLTGDHSDLSFLVYHNSDIVRFFANYS